MIQIDGSYQEGGGQILRTALGLASLTKQAFTITNIRAGRPKPGLRPQHLSAAKAAAELCNATLIGASVGSTKLEFYPRDIKSRTISVNIGTAGSVTLLLQALLPPLMFGGKRFRVKITGGTDVPFSPTSDYFQYVLLPHLRRFADIEFKIERRGFMPAGKGKIELIVKPKLVYSDYDNIAQFSKVISQPTPLNVLDQGDLITIKGSSIASNPLQDARVSERQAISAKQKLASLNVPISISTSYAETNSIGSAITLWAVFGKDDETSHVNPVIIGSNKLGEKNTRAEVIGATAATNLKDEIASHGAVDSYLADQLLPFLALTGGELLTSKVSNHSTTNIYAIQQFLSNKFEVRNNSIKIAPPT